MASPPNLLIITGPTGVGKTSAAVRVAEELDGEIISADSRQVYRGLVIGTAAPGHDLQERIPHHFINEIDPRKAWSAGAFAAQAAERIEDILSRGRQPIVVGGSGLYLRALIEGFFEEPDTDQEERQEVRDRLRERLEEEGLEVLYQELEERDPEWADRLEPGDTQRILRGLEVFEIHGTPLSELQEEHEPEPPIEANWCRVLLERDREDLYERLDQRVENLLDSGWLGEARSLQAAGVPSGAPGLTGLGYDVLFEHLRGALSLDDAVGAIQQRHRNYAKRQLTWFRNLEDAEVIHLEPEEGGEEAADRILEVWNEFTATYA